MAGFEASIGRGGHWRAALDACIDRLQPASASDRFGMVFVSDPLADALDLIVGGLARHTGVGSWLGTGAAGVIGGTEECFGDGAISVLIAPWPRARLRVFSDVERGLAAAASGVARAHGAAPVAIVHADARDGHLSEAIGRCAETTSAFMIGGVVSSERSAMQFADRPVEGHLAGALLDPSIEVVTGLTQGCVPIGPVHQVTSARGPWLLGLDERPAFEVLREEMGEVLARQPDRVGGYIHAALPRSAADRPDYLVRTILALEPRGGAIAIGATLRRGDPLLFVKRDVEAARLDLLRLLGDLKRRVGGRTVRGALYHACLARGPNLFGPNGIEIRMIREVFGAVPLAGFFANGEIFDGRLYTQTGILTLFL